MKKSLLFIAVSLATAGSVSAQNAIDAYNISQTDLRGTARFMSMAGAFGALGGDISTLTQNPAGIGVYRSSEVTATIDFDFQSVKTTAFTESQTKVYCNNFGYVGALNLDGDILKTFNWGASYTRKASFDRNYTGYFASLPTSLSNYIASFTDGIPQYDLQITDNFNPYMASDADWMSILGYNSMMINPLSASSTSYQGLYNPGHTTGDSQFSVSERGYLDEYSINFGGNLYDKVYWGVGVGISDLRFTQYAYYDEQLNNANIPQETTMGGGNGYAQFELNNFKRITGSGFNIKLGLIVKPIEQFRIGIAFHTPTWLSLSQDGEAFVDYNYEPYAPQGQQPAYSFKGSSQTDYDYFYYKLRTPWRVMVGAAGVIGGRFIISADYELNAYQSMHFSDDIRTDYSYENQDVKDMYQMANIFRIGAEYRITPKFSVRAGFSHTGEDVKKEFMNQNIYPVYTSGPYLTNTNPAYTFNKTTDYYTVGLGYRFSRFYIDAAFAYRQRTSQYQPFTRWESNVKIPVAEVNQSDSNLVLTLGYRF